MIDLTDERMTRLIRGLLGQYLKQGINPDKIDMVEFKEQIAERLRVDFDLIADPKKIKLRVLLDVDTQRYHIKTEPINVEHIGD
jgi:hypothetical protein